LHRAEVVGPHSEPGGNIDTLWAPLCEGGQTQQCGRLQDRFGLSWQIARTVLGEMPHDKDAAKASCVMQAMLKMVKLDIRQLKQAYEAG
jgi:predicted 3-demethylubiquinone-9 3-methyltransferase (glyoxalase superfamily)